MANQDFVRILPLSGVHNFRDYGGYTANGGRLRRQSLYRSAQHLNADAQDLKSIGALNLAAVIDLRSDLERMLAPCRRPPGFSARVIFVREENALAPHVEAEASVTDPETAHARMRAAYAEMPFRPYLVKALREYFMALAEHDGATLVHCMAGKDRTGIAVALFHKIVGVHPDDVMADYLLTNDAGQIEARIAAGAHFVRAAFGRDLSDETVRVLMSVAPDYLETAFAAIVDRHGSVETYLHQEVGVPETLREKLAARFME